jgi:hypothetical protein
MMSGVPSPTASKRCRGRPPLDSSDPSTELSVRVPSKEFDRLYQEARDERLPLPAYVRLKLGIAGSLRRPERE